MLSLPVLLVPGRCLDCSAGMVAVLTWSVLSDATAASHRVGTPMSPWKKPWPDIDTESSAGSGITGPTGHMTQQLARAADPPDASFDALGEAFDRSWRTCPMASLISAADPWDGWPENAEQQRSGWRARMCRRVLGQTGRPYRQFAPSSFKLA